MSSTRIVINTEIQTKPRPRASNVNGFARVYTPAKAQKYEMLIANEYMKQNGTNYKDSPLQVRILFYFKVSKSMPKYLQWAVSQFDDREYKCLQMYVPNTNPKDLDNLAKSVLDSLNGVAYNDDRQVISLGVHKYWTTGQEQIIIMINPLEPVNEEYIKKEYKLWKKLNK